jgi:DNA-binding transcriptional MerR regulator
MYKIGEVCQIAGVTRKELQEYKSKGLVCPNAVNNGGHWLYDKEAFKRIIIVQVLIHVGYTTEHIKRLLDSPGTELVGEFDNVVELLKEKKTRIDERINALRNIQQELMFSDITPELMANLAPEQRIETRNTLAAVRDTISIPEQ